MATADNAASSLRSRRLNPAVPHFKRWAKNGLCMMKGIHSIALALMLGIQGCERRADDGVETQEIIVNSKHALSPSSDTARQKPSLFESSIEFPGISELNEEDNEFFSNSMNKAVRQLEYDILSASTELSMRSHSDLNDQRFVQIAPNFKRGFEITKVETANGVSFILSLPSTIAVDSDSDRFLDPEEMSQETSTGKLRGNRIEMPNFVNLDRPTNNQIEKMEELVRSRSEKRLVSELQAFIQGQVDLSSMSRLLD